MNSIRLKAYAKINLGLDVIGKREDGYHEVRMVMQTVNLYDRLILSKTNNNIITMKTNLSYLPTNENNLVYKAAQLLKDEFKFQHGLHIYLDKRIPIAAGMAGGSSDAAATLVGINNLFHLGLSKNGLMKRGVKLGADIPYCILRGTALSEGIGEILTPLPPMPQCYIVIAKPNLHVSTKFVYENLVLDANKSHPDIDGMVQAIRNQDLSGVSSRLGNVLENVTIKHYPIIDEIKQALLDTGAMNTLMSGSGPTVFGLFKDYNHAKTSKKLLLEKNLAKFVVVSDFYNTKNNVMSSRKVW